MVAAQVRHLAEIRELWTQYASAAQLQEKLRGAMGWKTVAGNQYLTRYWNDPVSRKKHMSSLGRRSPETEAKKADFERRRAEADAAADRVTARLKPLIRVGRALRIGRIEPWAADVLRQLALKGLLGPGLMVIGSSAMHLYEASAGALLPRSVVADQDIELLSPAEDPLEALEELLPVIRRADRSFAINRASKSAGNEGDFRVRMHTRRSLAESMDRLPGASQDQLKVLRGLTAMEPVSAVTIARDGAPVEMTGMDPRAFALMKYAFANLGPRRMGPAARLAHDQAVSVARLVARFGSGPFDPEQLAAFPVFAEQVEAGDPRVAGAVDDTTVHRGGGDFLADQGIEDPDEFRVKAHLCNQIASVLEDRKLTQAKAAGITGEMQADLSRIVNARFDDYSVWRLMKILSALGTDVLIAVNPSGGNDRGVILSQTMGPEQI